MLFGSWLLAIPMIIIRNTLDQSRNGWAKPGKIKGQVSRKQMAKSLSKSGKLANTIQISREQARRFLATYHFRPTNIAGVIDRLRTVQYDPLNPVGRNPDLVFQARVPGYQVDDLQKAAYTDRMMYDAWDKQA